MRTVLVCRDLPYPPNSGSPIRMWQQLLIRDWSVIVDSDGAERPTLMTDMMRWSRDELCDIMFELMRDVLYPPGGEALS